MNLNIESPQKQANHVSKMWHGHVLRLPKNRLKTKKPKTGRKEPRRLQIKLTIASQTKLKSVGCTAKGHGLGNYRKYICVFYELEWFAFKFGQLIRNEWNILLWKYRLKIKVVQVMSSHMQCEYKQETRYKCHCPYVYGLQMCCFFEIWKHLWVDFLEARDPMQLKSFSPFLVMFLHKCSCWCWNECRNNCSSVGHWTAFSDTLAWT